MEEPSIWSLLISEKNISGVWVVIGALLAFGGVLVNNFFENKRLKKEREHQLIRDAYFGGVEYINYYFNIIANMHSMGTDDQLKVDPEITQKYYKLFLVASPDVLEAFTKLFENNTNIVFELGLITVDIKTLQSQIDLQQTNVQNGIEMMTTANDSRAEYNEKKENNPELWNLYEEQYEEGLRNSKQASIVLEKLNQDLLGMQIVLMKKSLSAMIDTSPRMYDAITSMRKDLDRKLKDHEKEKIKNSIDAMMSQLEKHIDGFIEQIDERINKVIAEA